MLATFARVVTPARGCSLAASLFFGAALLSAQVGTQYAEAGHFSRRLTVGPTPALLVEISSNGPGPYIATQLAPGIAATDPSANQSNAELQLLLTSIGVPSTPVLDPAVEYSIGDLARYEVALLLYSDWQLLEMLTYRWERLLNTNYSSVRNYFNDNPPAGGESSNFVATHLEHKEHAAFRANAFGTFLDLLEFSAKSPTMSIYLDGVENDASGGQEPNENYARELLELHTLGEDNSYDQTDVQNLAAVFAGWNFQRVPDAANPGFDTYEFFFDSAKAATITPGMQVLPQLRLNDGLGTPSNVTLTGTGQVDGEIVLAALANSEQCAEYICKMLYRFFVCDDDGTPAAQALIGQCMTAWGVNVGGDLDAVLTLLLNSPEMADPTNYWCKANMPVESILAPIRAFGGRVRRNSQLTTLMNLMESGCGQRLFRFGPPDGFTDVSVEQLGTEQSLFRVAAKLRAFLTYDPANLAQMLDASDNAADAAPEVFYNVFDLLASIGITVGAWTNETAIVDQILTVLYQGHHTAADHASATEFLARSPDGLTSVPLLTLATFVEEDSIQWGKQIMQTVAYCAAFAQGNQK
ncbi:MAG: DUF1800 family protein [Planctomycetota bacterium]